MMLDRGYKDRERYLCITSLSGPALILPQCKVKNLLQICSRNLRRYLQVSDAGFHFIAVDFYMVCNTDYPLGAYPWTLHSFHMKTLSVSGMSLFSFSMLQFYKSVLEKSKPHKLRHRFPLDIMGSRFQAENPHGFGRSVYMDSMQKST